MQTAVLADSLIHEFSDGRPGLSGAIMSSDKPSAALSEPWPETAMA
jgi:hypothetical protein